MSDPVKPASVLSVSFNQDASCFAVGTTDGFLVFRAADPFGEALRRNFPGGIGVVQMLYRCNIFAIIGASKSDRNKVRIWDDRLNRGIGELVFRSEVRAVRLRKDRIVVVMLHKIYVYSLSDFELIHQIETMENRQGLCEICKAGQMVLVCLGEQRGFVRVVQYATNKSTHVMAHSSSIACVALMDDGMLMATASTKGTLIRVFRTMDGSLLKELRRGSDRAVVRSISFSPSGRWLVVSSDKGTVHVFIVKFDSSSLKTCRSEVPETNKFAPLSLSRLSFIKGFLPKYFSSEWSMAQFRIPEGIQHIAAFGPGENTIAVVGSNGSYYRCQFDPMVGGDMTKLESYNF
ncbi:autophagy-related protein 18a-like [Salvia hispanica]|uniref:autophagy-related protein 18a-like n=1 Tax=Salvia hispanica TaxID=49212 RepID=UPI0020094244|nr:autophagy-related protein 18a-like [Salvia hispanica]